MKAVCGRLFVAVHTRKELDTALDEAVGHLRPAAMTERVGIAVTRLAPRRYEVRLSSDVPPGATIERWGSPLQ
jgi:hypothetical protein